MFRSLANVRLIFLIVTTFVPPHSAAQSNLDTDERESVIATLSSLLTTRYIFPDVAEQCADHLQRRLADGAYADVTDPSLFAGMLTADLRSISHDGHMNVNLNTHDTYDEPDPAAIERQRQDELLASKRDNFAFRRMEWLPGNVGLLEFRSFRHTEFAGPTAVAAMNFLAHADAIIIDLRSNRGGDPTMIQLISSYFFDEPVHLNSFQIRGQEQIEQRWTLPHVPGPRMADAPLFILIGSYTYSAAEEFAYNLQALGRATLIGATSGGGAHPTRNYRINDTFAASIPYARAINPVTGTNWEGVGVEPDITVATGGYLRGRQVAHIAALEAILPTLDESWYRDSVRGLMRGLMEEVQSEIDATDE